jgi:hypothetical protein
VDAVRQGRLGLVRGRVQLAGAVEGPGQQVVPIGVRPIPERIAKPRRQRRVASPVIEREERQLTVVDAASRCSELTDAVDGRKGIRRRLRAAAISA